jgi:type VI secretion system secreted protein Hcp
VAFVSRALTVSKADEVAQAYDACDHPGENNATRPWDGRFQMASDTFAKIGDIKGESLDSKHKDEIEVLSWSWGVTQTGSVAHGGGGGAGRAVFQDFTFTHHLDKASPVLLKACATGEHIRDATVTVRKAGKGQQDYLIIKMTDVIITGVAIDDDGGQAATAERVLLQFAKVDLEYKPQKADGSLDAGIHFKYDIKGNKEG